MRKFEGICIICLFFFNCFVSALANEKQLDSLKIILQNSNEAESVPVLMEIMELQFSLQLYDDAEESAKHALKIAEDIKLNNDVTDIYLFLSAFYLYVDDVQQKEYAQKALTLSDRINYYTAKIRALQLLGEGFRYESPDSAKNYLLEAKNIAEKQNLNLHIAKVDEILGAIHFDQSMYQQAMELWQEALMIYRETENLSGIATILNNIGIIYRRRAEYKTAIEYFQEALAIQEKLGNTKLIANSLANIGNVYHDYGLDYAKAIEYYNKALDYFAVLGDSMVIGQIKFNIAFTLMEQNRFDEAHQITLECLDLYESLGYHKGMADTYQNLGDIHKMKSEYKLAIEQYNKALSIFVDQNDNLNLVYVYLGMGETLLQINSCSKALDYLSKGLKLAEELNLKGDLIEFYKLITQAYECKGDLRLALDYFKQYDELKDTVFKEEHLEQFNELQTKYETKQKEQEIQNQKLALEKQSLDIKRQRLIIIFGGSFILLFILFSFILYRQFVALKKANNLLYEKNEEITAQRDQISEQADEIRSSIKYASTIQSASLPPDALFGKLFRDYFTFFRPRDIVSGDFYWLSEVDDKIIITAADCTGHGVPGAFMSMMGMSLLNEIVNRSRVLEPAKILTQMKDNIIKALHQHGTFDSIHDGMDMALCVIEKDMTSLQFAGAYNPLLIVRKGEIIDIKATRRPVSYYERDIQFEQTRVDLEKNDCLYLFSDGYADQFGGDTRKKFMMRRFKELLINIHPLTMSEQEKEITRNFDVWKKNVDQVDDVLVLGIRI